VARALADFGEAPGAAVEAAYSAAGDEAPLLTPELLDMVQRHLPANPEKGWEFFGRAVRTLPGLFTKERLDGLCALAETGPGSLMNMLNLLRQQQPERAGEMIGRLVPLMHRFPKEGIHAVYYGFQREEDHMTPGIIDAVCAGFAGDAYNAYSILGNLVERRPDLLGRPQIEAALRNIPHATNYAFGFFRHLLEKSPTWTEECTMALFECLALEPVNRAHVRKEEIEKLLWISEAAHIRTGLEEALRKPPRVGSRRARALMAILFRQASRSKRHVLIEALTHAAVSITWSDRNWTPLWDFLMFIIDNSPGESVSTAAAEQFLEGALQLSFVAVNGAEHDAFLKKLDLRDPPEAPFPPQADFLADDAELVALHRVVAALGARFGVESRLKPLDRFLSRMQDDEIELTAIGPRIESATGERRERMLEREKALNRRAAWRLNPEYARAFRDPAAERRLPPEAAEFMRHERRDLIRAMMDALRAEAIRIAVTSLDTLRMDLYRTRLRHELGEDRDFSTIEPRILPALLFFRAVSHLRKSSKWLRRLILDALEGKPHDWMRSEPPVLEWAARVKAAFPEVRIERWRAAFERRVDYRRGDARKEKLRRQEADLAQARGLLAKAGVKPEEGLEELRSQVAALRAQVPPPPVPEAPDSTGPGEPPPAPPVDPAILDEIEMNLTRVEASRNTPESEYEGEILFVVETDPFEVLYMGEYGFASCLSLRGSNAWGAVSNAIDIDKVIVWAKEPGGNVVGRRLLVLTDTGILSFRTYTNRHGLTLDAAFDSFIEEYARHVGAPLTRGRGPGPLLSDQWYDDVAI
ncbi:MAG: hypothetical protein HUU15_05675, partial [Candidatus Brocadiae bacterium]|nr:hypothetical protein [Candidatus Brocadiia bacterium]